MEQQNYYIIIPAPVFNDEELSDKEKLLMGLINSLKNEDGYCYASNNYLSKKMKTTPETISRRINKLKSREYLEIVYLKRGNIVTNRKIFTNSPLMETSTTDDKNINGTVDENVKESNKDISNKTIYIKKENIKRKKYGIYKRILLSDEEYKKLVEDYNEELINNHIKYLDEYIESNNNKNKYSNWNLVLRKSIKCNWFKNQIIEDLSSKSEAETEIDNQEELFDYDWLEENE